MRESNRPPINSEIFQRKQTNISPPTGPVAEPNKKQPKSARLPEFDDHRRRIPQGLRRYFTRRRRLRLLPVA